MKKMVMVLMMVFGLSAAFAKPVVSKANIGGSEYTFVSDDENKQKDFGCRSDTEIVKLLKSCVPTKIGEKNTVYVGYLFNDSINNLANEYFSYFLFSKDGTSMFVDENLGDGRMVRLIYLLDETIENAEIVLDEQTK